MSLFDVFGDKEQYHSVLEYCEGGSLSERRHPLSEMEASAVLRALNYMHQTLKIAHRDVKAEKILFKFGGRGQNFLSGGRFEFNENFTMGSGSCQGALRGPAALFIVPGTFHVRDLAALYRMSQRKGGVPMLVCEKKWGLGGRPRAKFPQWRPI